MTFATSSTKDQTVICAGGLNLDIAITSDYNGADVTCNGECDGEITVTPSGTPGPFSYRENPSEPFVASNVFTGLCPGSYTIEVVDSSQVLAPGIFLRCTAASETISDVDQITFNPIAGIQVPIPETCPGTCDGQAFTSSGGGTGTLVVSWPNSGEITSNPVGLCGGFNDVTIVDDNGCTHNDQLFLSIIPTISFDITITPPSCNGDSNGELLISNEAGGNGGPYTYSYNPVPGNGQGSNPATGYPDGFVTISVFDVDLCQQDSLVEIIEPAVLSTTAINPQDVSCFGICDGTITALPVGGVAPYTFEWFDNNSGLTTGFTDSIPNTFVLVIISFK